MSLLKIKHWKEKRNLNVSIVEIGYSNTKAKHYFEM